MSSTGKPRYRLIDVFTPRRPPKVTFIDRSSSESYKPFSNALLAGGLLNLHGDSKTGKTVACSRMVEAITGNSPIILSGRIIKSEDDFWRYLADGLSIPTSEIDSQHYTKTDAHADKVLAGVNFVVARSQADIEKQKVETSGGGTNRIRFSNNQQIINKWSNDGRVVIIDDFHDIPIDTQVGITFVSKAAIDHGGMLIFISIPDRATEVTQQMVSRGEAIARYTVFESPVWTVDEIRQIGIKGFDALNLMISAKVLDVLALASYRSPMLMQLFCLGLCCKYNVGETADAPTDMSFISEDDARSIVSEVAATFKGDFSDYIRLGKTDTKLWTLKNNKEVNIYTLSMLAMAGISINSEVGYKRLQERASALIAANCDVPRLEDISKAVRQISSDIESKKSEKSGFDPELVAGEKYAFISHPFFKLFLMWHLVKRFVDFPVKG